MMKRMRKRPAGFTLLEMLIVIVLIAILATIIVPRLMGAGAQAAKAQLLADTQTIQEAANLYEAEQGDWPADWDALTDTATVVNPDKTYVDDSSGEWTTNYDLTIDVNGVVTLDRLTPTSSL